MFFAKVAKILNINYVLLHKVYYIIDDHSQVNRAAPILFIQYRFWGCQYSVNTQAKAALSQANPVSQYQSIEISIL